LPVRAQLRTTLIAPEVAANVQPIQTGVPEPTLASPAPTRRRARDEDPWAPLGVRIGNIVLFPVLGQSFGYDTNPDRVQIGRKGSALSQTEAELRLQSDWSRHELTGFVRAAYNEYFDLPSASRPEAGGRLGFRLDVTRNTQIDLGARFQVDTQRSNSPDLLLTSVSSTRPIVFSEGATVGLTHRFNRLSVGLTGDVDRTDFEDVRQGNGTVIDQSDRNYTQLRGRLRLAYEMSPSLVPFAEAIIDTRAYDRRIDNDGFRRSSDGTGGRVGARFELTRLVTGEISAGAIERRYEDPRLRSLTSPIADVALAWSVSPLTTVRATAQALVEETTVPNATGIAITRGTLEVAHDLRRNLTVTAGVSASEADYRGVSIRETGFGATLRADYRMTRQIGVRASYNYERLDSSAPGGDYTANVFLLGLRLQP
jgi:hypothetical protein